MHSLLIHPSNSVAQVSSTFWPLWIMLPWTRMCIYIFEILFSVLFSIYPEVGLLDHMVILFLIFEELPCSFPQWLHYFAPYQQGTRVLVSPQPHKHFFLNVSHPDRYEVVSHFNLTFLSLTISEVAKIIEGFPYPCWASSKVSTLLALYLVRFITLLCVPSSVCDPGWRGSLTWDVPSSWERGGKPQWKHEMPISAEITCVTSAQIPLTGARLLMPRRGCPHGGTWPTSLWGPEHLLSSL